MPFLHDLDPKGMVLAHDTLSNMVNKCMQLFENLLINFEVRRVRVTLTWTQVAWILHVTHCIIMVNKLTSNRNVSWKNRYIFNTQPDNQTTFGLCKLCLKTRLLTQKDFQSNNGKSHTIAIGMICTCTHYSLTTKLYQMKFHMLVQWLIYKPEFKR